MILEKVKISELKPLEKNVRKHSEKQIQELVRSVKQFGQTRAMVIDEENNILIGNGLYMALLSMGKEECECFRKTGLSEVQKKKLILTDNKVYSLGSDNFEEINNYIQDITVTGDFDIAGFDDFILQSMVMSEEEAEEEMKEYGKITDMNFYEPTPVARPTVAPQPVAPSANNERVTIVTETEVSAPKVERKYVICPNCGEMIYID